MGGEGDNKNNNINNDEEFKDELLRAQKILNKKKQDKEKHSIMKALVLISQLGLQMVFCIGLGVFAGVFLDRFLGTVPLFIIIFSILGAAASIKIIYDISKDWKD